MCATFPMSSPSVLWKTWWVYDTFNPGSQGLGKFRPVYKKITHLNWGGQLNHSVPLDLSWWTLKTWHHHDTSQIIRLWTLDQKQGQHLLWRGHEYESSTRAFTRYHLHPPNIFLKHLHKIKPLFKENKVFSPCGWKALSLSVYVGVVLYVCETGPVWQCYIMPDKCPSLLETINKVECLSPSHPLEDNVCQHEQLPGW